MLPIFFFKRQELTSVHKLASMNQNSKFELLKIVDCYIDRTVYRSVSIFLVKFAHKKLIVFHIKTVNILCNLDTFFKIYSNSQNLTSFFLSINEKRNFFFVKC